MVVVKCLIGVVVVKCLIGVVVVKCLIGVVMVVSANVTCALPIELKVLMRLVQ